MTTMEADQEQEAKLDFQFLIQKHGPQIQMIPVDEETRPDTLDEVYGAICILKRNLEAQQTAALTQQVMMQAATQMKEQFEDQGKKTKSGLVIPENKNIR